jgi:hypothetical protein
MARHQALAEAKQARHLAVQSGSGWTDTVQQSGAAKAFLTRLDVELRRPSLSKGAFGPLEEENAHGPRGGSGSGRDEKPRVPRRRATGQPGAASSGASASTYRANGLPRVTGGGATGRTPRGHPNCSGGHVRSGRHRRRHGQPGQRERRQLGDGGRETDQTEPGGTCFRVTGGGASSNGAGQPADRAANGHRPPSLAARRAM